MKPRRMLLSLAILVVAVFVASGVQAHHAQYYVLDGFGGVHAGGGAPGIGGGIPYFGFDIAKSIAFVPSQFGADGVLVLDGFGGVHASTDLGIVSPATPYFGFDVARAITYRNIPPRLAGSELDTGNTTVTSTTYVSMRSVTINAPDDGVITTTCSASIGCQSCTAANIGAVRVAIGVDAVNETGGINRQVAFTSTTFGAQSWTQTIAVTQGSHTVHCVIRDNSFTLNLQYFDPTMSAMFVDHNASGESAPEVGNGGPTGIIRQ